MADNPDIQWALKILTPEPDYKPSLLTEYGFVFIATTSTLLGGFGYNVFSKKAFYSGIQRHLLVAALVGVGAYAFENANLKYVAQKDQVLRDYVIQHPEDFPPPERKKWAEILEPWYPIR